MSKKSAETSPAKRSLSGKVAVPVAAIGSTHRPRGRTKRSNRLLIRRRLAIRSTAVRSKRIVRRTKKVVLEIRSAKLTKPKVAALVRLIKIRVVVAVSRIKRNQVAAVAVNPRIKIVIDRRTVLAHQRVKAVAAAAVPSTPPRHRRAVNQKLPQL
uniref:(northern house mosquito) hypothetical protein n=1 Tax=Culex pipiens TaxID=7175 RepID=A0A8D8AHD2_CULPI